MSCDFALSVHAITVCLNADSELVHLRIKTFPYQSLATFYQCEDKIKPNWTQLAVLV